MKYLFPLLACSLTATFAATCDQISQEPLPISKQCALEAFKSEGISFGFYGELLYLQPNGSNLYYGVEAIGLDQDIAVPAASPNWKILEIDPKYHLGFEIGANVLLNEANLNMQASWERLHTHDSASFTASSAAGYMVGPFFDIGPNSVAYKIAQGKARFHFDQVNLSFGKQFCFFNNLYLQLSAGASVARIKQSLVSKYSNNSTGTISRSVAASSTFIGAGPQIGLDYRYRICNHFFFSGNSTLSLFMGRLKNSNTFKSFTPTLATLGIPQPNKQSTDVPNRTQLVPGFEQKLGFSYIATYKHVQATFEIGYRCQIYGDAVQTVDMTAPQVLPALSPVTPDVGVFAVGFERTMSNYILTGLYATVGLEF